jgi:hypothetical protein
LSNPAASARVDVEPVVLCDVLADGTVAATVLVEPVYDASSGDRIGTRTVDPATGAVYVPQGTLQACPPPDSCTCETLLLCDVTTASTPGETPERITNGNFAADTSGWTLTGGARYVPSSSPDGSVGFLDLSADNNPAGSAEQTVTVTPGLTYTLSARIGIWGTGGTTPQSVLVEVVDGSGAVLYSETVAPVETSGGPQWPADGVVGPAPIVATDTEMTVRFSDQVGGDFIDALVDDVSLLGPGVPGTDETQAVPFLRTICRTCTGTAAVTDTTLDGTTIYAVQGEIGACGPTGDTASARQVVERCGCDDVNGDSTVINRYIELWAVSTTSDTPPTLLGTWLDGDFTQPYIPANPIDCPAEPDCGDTELIELCDTVPPQQPPIPTPGGGFTLTGSVYNSSGTLVFSEGQTPVNGVATGTVSSVVPGQPYEFNYQAGWNGNGGGVTPLPEAMYLLEILDGSAVIASRIENLSNGSTASGPLGFRAPLAFTAPSSGTVTIRVSDWTTNAGTTRDLLVRPETVTSTLITVVPFVRAITYGCDGLPDTTLDYLPDGVTAYQVLGTVGNCPTARDCGDCESQILCDGQSDDEATIYGANVSSGTMSNGIGWTSTSGATSSFGSPVTSEISNTDGAWWGNPESFPLTQVLPYRFTLARPTVTEFSVFFIYQASSPTANTMQLPPNVTPVFLPPGWTFDAATSRVTVGPDHGLTVAQQTALMASPDLAHSPRFRTLGPVSEFTTTWLGGRYAFQGSFRTSWTGSISTVPSVPFLRTICRDCDGEVTSVRDTTLDGSAVYTPSGVVGLCPDTSSCSDCETIVLCDDGGDDPATIRILNASTQTLSNGVVYTVRGDAAGPAGAVQSKIANADGAWWGNGEPAPNTVGTAYTIGASVPVTIEFSIHLAYDDTPGATGNCVQLPTTVEPVELPSGYTFDPVTGLLCVTAQQDQANICADMANPTRLRAARLRTTSLTTSVIVDWLGTATHDVCGVQRTLWLGAIEMTPPGQFMRRICHGCDGSVTAVIDTLMDGATSYTPRGAAVLCQPEPCCEPVQICVTPRATGEVQFVSNPEKRDDGTEADTFTWAPSGGGSDPSAVTTWYPMYNKKYPGTAWQTADSATRNNGQPNSPTAGWIAPHAGAMVVSTGLPGEGPQIANPSNWWARSSFTIPAAADLSTVKMEITTLNADQVPVRYRINDGDWVNGGGFYSTATPYKQAPVPLTGAVAGENFLYFEVNENASQPDASNGAGVIAHFILTYAVPGQASWTKMVCCSGDVYYLDQFENRHDTLPDGTRIIPCKQEQPITLCDDAGTFIRWVQDLDGTVVTRDTDLQGNDYTPLGTVRSCASA